MKILLFSEANTVNISPANAPAKLQNKNTSAQSTLGDTGSLSFIFLCFTLIIIHYHTQKQRKLKIELRINLNHKIYSSLTRLFPLQIGTNITSQTMSWRGGNVFYFYRLFSFQIFFSVVCSSYFGKNYWRCLHFFVRLRCGWDGAVCWHGGMCHIWKRRWHNDQAINIKTIAALTSMPDRNSHA